MQKEMRPVVVTLCSLLDDAVPFDFLRTALQDHDADVRIAASIALAGLAEHADPSWLTPLLQDDDYEVRGYAEKAMLAFGDRAPIQPVVDALIERGADFEDQLAEVLGKYKDRFPRGILESLVKSHGEVAAVIIGELGDAAPVDLLISLLEMPFNEKNRAMRFEALLAAQKIKRPELAPVLFKIMQDEHDDSRYSATEALGAIGDPAFIPAILALLPSTADFCLDDIANGLEGFGEHMPVEAMLRFIQENPQRDIAGMVSAFAKAGGNTPLDFLMALAQDPTFTPESQGAAANALAVFAAAGLANIQQYNAIIELLLQLLAGDGDKMMRYNVAFSLGLIKDIVVLNPLCTQALGKNKDGFVALNAAHGLYLLALQGIHAPIELWSTILEETADMRRKFAIVSLGCRDDAPTEIFLKYLTDRHLKELVAEELIKHTPMNARELATTYLTELAQEHDDPLSGAAQKALVSI